MVEVSNNYNIWHIAIIAPLPNTWHGLSNCAIILPALERILAGKSCCAMLNIIELQLNSKKRKLEQFLRMLLIHLASIPEKSHRAGRYPLLRLWLCFRDIWQFGFLQHPVHLAGGNHAKEMWYVYIHIYISYGDCRKPTKTLSLGLRRFPSWTMDNYGSGHSFLPVTWLENHPFMVQRPSGIQRGLAIQRASQPHRRCQNHPLLTSATRNAGYHGDIYSL